MNPFTQTVIAGLISGILTLDSVQIAQFLFSRPFFAGALTGLVNGCPLEGAVFGLFFDLLYSSEIPAGGTIPPNGLAGTVAAVTAYSAAGFTEPLSFFYGLIFSWLYSPAERKLRKIRSSWNIFFAEDINAGRTRFGFWFVRSYVLEFLTMFVFVLTAGMTALVFSQCFRQVACLQDGAAFAYSVIPVTGIAVLYFRFRNYIVSGAKSAVSASDYAETAAEATDGQTGIYYTAGTEDKKLLRCVFGHLFLIQSCWNYERYQNFGFLYAVMPFLNSIYIDSEEKKKAMLRNFESVNTNPVMAPLLAGATAQLEKDIASGAEKAERCTKIKQSLSAALASFGDRIFWAKLRPVSLQTGLFLWIICGFSGWLFNFHIISYRPSHMLLIAGPLFSVIAYSVAACFMRWKCLLAGFYGREKNLYGLTSLPLEKMNRALDISGFIFSIALVIWLLCCFFMKIRFTGDDMSVCAVKTAVIAVAVLLGRFIASRAVGAQAAASAVFLIAVFFSITGLPLISICL